MDKTKNFSSRLGFILTAVGSAVGMANVWGFPYKLQAGGGYFLIFYLIFIGIFGYVGLSAEFAIGRLAKTGTLGSYEYALNSKKKNKKHSFVSKWIGMIPLLGSLCIAIGYAVIVSYVFKALVDSLTGSLMSVDTKAWFEGFSNQAYSVVIFHAFIIAITLFTCIGGAHTIEKTNKVMMPAFFVLFIILAVRIFMLPNSLAGYKYMFRFDKSQLNFSQALNAMGQAFFSLSVTGSGMIVCGSYLSKNEDIVSSSKSTAIFDTIAAMVAAFVIIPAITVYKMDQVGGPGMLFEVLPTILQDIPYGRIFSIILYTAVVFAGISSLQNMFEVIAESVLHKFPSFKRSYILIAIGLVTFLTGVNMENIASWGPWMDFVSIYIIPIGATIGAISWFWILRKEELLGEINSGSKKKYGHKWLFVGKYIYVPIAVILCFVALVFKMTF
ncbi:MAG: sodium-dependent transporter [Peptoniphilaceae bacterium]|nr:sodium-dependent transporter [Peptoniphilaceae bacterium]MDY6018596.1 sodium-dependent transporter [Anaerococcus sp.]